jgi:hypothetical protein
MALSTTEAEYVAVSRAGKKLVHFRQLMQDVHQLQGGATTDYEDIGGAVKLANNHSVVKPPTSARFLYAPMRISPPSTHDLPYLLHINFIGPNLHLSPLSHVKGEARFGCGF